MEINKLIEELQKIAKEKPTADVSVEVYKVNCSDNNFMPDLYSDFGVQYMDGVPDESVESVFIRVYVKEDEWRKYRGREEGKERNNELREQQK